MVRAILREIRAPGTGKTVTRRLAWGKQFAASDEAVRPDCGWKHDGGGLYSRPTPWQKVKPGDVLWIRETWRTENAFNGIKPNDLPWWEVPALGGPMPIWYEADGAPPLRPGLFPNQWAATKRVAIHLPAVGARIKLTVAGAALEPIQAITDDGAIAEGARCFTQLCGRPAWTMDQEHGNPITTPRAAFGAFWRFLHGAASWDLNPEVVAISFKPELIDRTAR